MIRRCILTAMVVILPLMSMGSGNVPPGNPSPPPAALGAPAAITGSLEDVTTRADAIVVGTVTSTNSYWNAEHNLIYTDATVSVENTVKGEAPLQKVTVTVLGGQVGDITLSVSEMASFKTGERAVLFLKRSQDDTYAPIDGSRGKKVVEGGRIGEHTVSEYVGQLRASMAVQGLSSPSQTSVVYEPLSVTLPEGTPITAPPESSISPLATGWNTIITEGFEGTFPSTGWTASAAPTATQAWWGKTNYNPLPGQPASYRAWPAREGSAGLDPATNNYPHNMNTWMVYGPFSLSDATDAELNLSFWVDTEQGVDKLGILASRDGLQFYGYAVSGPLSTWISDSFDLKAFGSLGNLAGDSSVWIAFIFQSNASINAKGAFVDDIELLKYVPSGPVPVIADMTPESASAGTDTQVTVSGTNFGAPQGAGKVTFYYQEGEPRIEAPVVSWSDTSIVVKVPVGTINGYPASASSGPVIVTNNAGESSAGYQYDVTFSYIGKEWPGEHPQIHYRTNPNTPDITGEEIAFQAAAETWSDVSGADFDLVYDGPTVSNNGTLNGINEILWRSLGTENQGVIAWAHYWSSGSNFVEFDIEFNEDFTWSTSGAAGAMDVQNIATHELGHALGLRDLYGDVGTPNDLEKTMFGRGSTGETKKRTLEPADEAGLRWMYPRPVPQYTLTSYATGTLPHSTAVGDLDGDGDLDLAVANHGSNTINVLKNNGNGTFQAKVDYGVGDYSLSNAIADMDGDGHLDLVASNFENDTVSVLKNNGNGTFQSKVDYSTGDGPYGLTVGDIDGDGDIDVAVANRNSNTVSVLKNNGNGTFQAKVDYTTGTTPRPVAVADLDGDGRPELVVGNGNSNTVSVLKNNGNGTFQAKVDYTTGTNPAFVSAGDLDGDGYPDLVVANHDSGTVNVLRNNGNGTFQGKVDYTVGTYLKSVAIADLDDDGKPDLAVGNAGGNALSVLMNKGDGTFQTQIDYPAGSATGVAIADLDGDGHADLAVTNYNGNTVNVFLTNPPPTVTVTYPNGGEQVNGIIAVSANASDPNGAIAQVALAYSNDNGSTWSAIGSDSTSPYSVSWNTTPLTDGDQYLIRATATDSANSTLQDVSDARFTVDNNAPLAPVLITPINGTTITTQTPLLEWSDVSDISGVTYDVQVDNDSAFGSPAVNATGLALSKLAVSSALPLGTHYWRASARETTGLQRIGNWSAPFSFTVANPPPAPQYTISSYATSNSPHSVAIGDLDGDGDLDMAVANHGSNTLNVMKNNGNGTFQAKVDYGVGDYSLSNAIADMDGDGHLDLVASNFENDTVSVLKNNGNGTFQGKIDLSTGDGPYGLTVGDFDGDGDIDVAVANRNSNTVSVLKNNGNGTFQSKVDYPTGTTPRMVAVADLDGDGRPELVVGNGNSNTMSVLKNNGNGTFQGKVDYTTGNSPYFVEVGDLDEDGYPDLVVSNYDSGTVSVFKNNGNSTFQNRVDYAAGTLLQEAALADLDDDGHPDLAVGNAGGDTVSVLMSNGDGTFRSKIDYPMVNATAVAIGDFDGDGHADLAVTNYNGNTVNVFLTNQPPTVTVTYPNGGETVSGAVAVSASASDLDGTIAQVAVEYSTDDGATWSTVGSDATAPYSVSWNTTALPNGAQYLIRATATDNKNSTSSDTSDAVFTVENNQPPAVAVTYPNGGEKVKGVVTVSANASDSDGSITQVAFEYSSNNGAAWNALGSDSTAPYSVSWNTSTVSDGTQYLVRATASDNGSATSTDGSNAVFVVDNTPPDLPVLRLQDGTFSDNSSLVLNWYSVSDISGVTYDIQVDDDPAFGSPLVDQTGIATRSYTLAAGTPNGAYYWRVRAVDGAGNAGQWTASRSFTIAAGVIWWQAQLIASGGSVSDNSSYFGLSSSASDQFDEYDSLKPDAPSPPFVRLYFPHQEWATDSGNYTQDIRPPSGYISWTFQVETSFDGDVTLTWDVLPVPQTYNSVSLIDAATGDVLVDFMRGTESHVYTAQAGVPRSFKVVVSSTRTTLAPAWNLFSIPADLTASGNDFASESVLGDEYPGSAGLYLFWYNPSLGGYDMWSLASKAFGASPSRGYWLKSATEKEIDVDGYPVPDEDYVIHLSPGWNLIGQPFNYAVNWGDAMVSFQGTTVGIGDAGNTWVMKYLYWYNSSAGSYVMETAPGGQLVPWRGYWVKATAAADLIIPKSGS